MDSKNETFHRLDKTKARTIVHLIRQYKSLFPYFNQDIITLADILSLYKKLNGGARYTKPLYPTVSSLKSGKEDDYCRLTRYKEYYLKPIFPTLTNNKLNNSMAAFEKAFDLCMKDPHVKWIEDFFAQYKIEQEAYYYGSEKSLDNDLFSIRSRYSTLYSPLMQEKYIVTDTFLEQQFPEGFAIKDGSLYPINRLFLHAVTTHPQQWSDLFFIHFSKALAFISQDSDAQAYKETLYPEELLKQLVYLQDYYLYIHNDTTSAPENERFFVCMKHFIPTIEHLHAQLIVMPIETDDDLLNYSSILKSIITNGQQLNKLRRVPRKDLASLMDLLDNKFIQSIIKTKDDFISVMEHLSDNKKQEFAQYLDIDFLKPFILSANDFVQLINFLTEKQKLYLIESVGNDFLKSLIKDGWSLYYLFKVLPEDRGREFLNYLDNDFLKTCIKTADDFAFIITLLSQTRQDALIIVLGSDVLALITDPYALRMLVKDLTDTQKSSMMERFSNDFLKSLIKNYFNLDQVIAILPQDRKPAFLNGVDYDFILSIIVSFDNFVRAIQSLPESKKITLVQDLGQDFFKRTIQDIKEYKLFIELLCATKNAVFIRDLGHDFLKPLIKNTNDFCLLLDMLFKTPKANVITCANQGFFKTQIIKYFPKNPRTDFVTFLGADLLLSIIKNHHDFTKVANYLCTSQQRDITNLLGRDFFKSVIKNKQQLEEVVCALHDKESFIDLLDADFLHAIGMENFEYEEISRVF